MNELMMTARQYVCAVWTTAAVAVDSDPGDPVAWALVLLKRKNNQVRAGFDFKWRCENYFFFPNRWEWLADGRANFILISTRPSYLKPAPSVGCRQSASYPGLYFVGAGLKQCFRWIRFTYIIEIRKSFDFDYTINNYKLLFNTIQYNSNGIYRV